MKIDIIIIIIKGDWAASIRERKEEGNNKSVTKVVHRENKVYCSNVWSIGQQWSDN